MCVCVCALKSVYFGSKLLFKQVLLKTMERSLLFLILFFQVSLIFFLCWDLDGKRIVSYLLPKRFQPYFWSSSGVVQFWADSLSFYYFNNL